MVQVTIHGQIKEYPDNAAWSDVVRDYQSQYARDILLVRVNGKPEETHRRVRPCTLDFITGEETAGAAAYQRSAVMLMLKAFYHVVGAKKVEKVTVHFSIGNALFAEPKGDFALDRDLVERVREQMEEYVRQNIPIRKRNLSTEDAMEMFHRHRMYDKEKLFRYRLVSSVNIYNMDSFEDYYYGDMVERTGLIKQFDLQPYRGGLMLVLPQPGEGVLRPFQAREKLFATLWDSARWGERVGVENAGELNEVIARGELGHLILIQEAYQEKKIAEIAARIDASKDVKLVMIAGPSSSGKTTFSHRLSIQLEGLGHRPHPIEVDNYFVDRELSPRDESGNYDFESLRSMDIELFNNHMTALLWGEEVELPHYNFQKGKREYRGDKLKLGPDDILVIEGIHCLNDALSYALPKESKFKIYISALTQLNIDEHNRIPTTDGRLLRRIVRDARTRGHDARATIARWPSVRRGEEENIFPYQEQADAMFNSALVYELAALKLYAVPLLFSIPKDCPEYEEARRLLKFLDYFIGADSVSIPNNSILREFIGGSCLDV